MRAFLPDVRDRARAAFLGMAVGDALGATVEFMTRPEIRSRYGVHQDIVGGGWLHLAPGRVTDDTEMALCLARAVDDAGGWSLPAVADAFAAWLKAGPVDVGSTCRKGIRRYLLDGTLEGAVNEWDAGNGAAMRMPPVALLSLGDEALHDRLAIEQARITHNHPLSDAACQLVGRLVQLACLGRSLRQLRAAVDAFPAFAFAPYRGLATGFVVDTMQTVLHHFFTTRSFEECVVAVVNQGGDADTTGAIAGAIAGAYYGPAEIPYRWRRRMDRRTADEVERLALRMIELAPVSRGPAAPSSPHR